MSLSIDAFDLPPQPVAVQELRLRAEDGGPLVVSSHGFRYTVSGNTLLPASKIRALLEQAESPTQAVQSLNAAYRDAGYFLVALRAQVKAHEVALEVIEGQISKVDAPADIRRFYDGVEFDPALKENELVRRNILAEAYASRSGLGFRPSVAPGQQPGGTTLTVQAPEQPGFKPVSGSVLLGNYGSRYVSGMVLGENLTVRPGNGLELNLGYTHGLPGLLKDSSGSRYDAVNAGASLVTPWGFYGLNFSRSAYRVGLAAAPLNPTGETQTWGVTGSQLVYGSPVLRISTTQGLTHVSNVTTVFQGIYTLTDQNYNYASVGLQASRNLTVSGLPGIFNLGLSYNLGLSGPIGTLAKTTPGLPTSRFHYWGLTSNWQQTLPGGWSSNLVFNGQWGQDTLPQNQQWVLGGYGNLAAWTPGVLVGDGGYLLRATLQTPNWQWRGWQVSAQGFAEQGGVTNHFTPAGTTGWQMLADVGVGMTWTSPWKTQLSLMAARPVANKNVTATTLRSQRAVYFVLQQPF
jgi:hemolysin activation/secretion protein